MGRILMVVLLAFPMAAFGQQIFKYRTPEGRIVFSDRPVAGATLVEEFDRAPPPDPAAAAAVEAKWRARAKEVNERATERTRALDAISTEIQAASTELERARAALEAGREPLEGERIGTYGGRARLNDAYWERQASNEYAVAEAQARLDRAQRALIQMR
jgi:hypothetical protein